MYDSQDDMEYETDGVGIGLTEQVRAVLVPTLYISPTVEIGHTKSMTPAIRFRFLYVINSLKLLKPSCQQLATCLSLCKNSSK